MHHPLCFHHHHCHQHQQHYQQQQQALLLYLDFFAILKDSHLDYLHKPQLAA
jgi:hypothetical protein